MSLRIEQRTKEIVVTVGIYTCDYCGHSFDDSRKDDRIGQPIGWYRILTTTKDGQSRYGDACDFECAHHLIAKYESA